MPELPEVETIRRDLAPELRGRTICRVRIRQRDLLLGPRSPRSFRRRVEGRRILEVGRRAKYLLFRLDGGGVLQTQLRMTGRFALGTDLPDPDEFRHVGAEFLLDDGRTLFYDDVRRLGGFELHAPGEWAAVEATLGPEPLHPSFTGASLAAILGRSRAPVKSVLLDQRRLAGVGNIYASEALYLARLDPRRPANRVDLDEARRLHRSVRHVLRRALERAGTTFRDYRAVNGRSGSFQTELRAYGRDGARCGRCAGRIERIVQSGRSTYLCPGCQR